MIDLTQYGTHWGEVGAFINVVLIDVALAGDNAIIIGALAAKLPPADRRRVVLIGTLAALILRILFSFFAVRLLNIIGLQLAGGLLLLWVAWKMYRELRHEPPPVAADTAARVDSRPDLWRTAWAVTVADVSMSLDNVLAVAGAAHEHPTALIFGLGLSILLMGAAADWLARIIQRQRWIAYLGLLTVVFVALKMILKGSQQVGIG